MVLYYVSVRTDLVAKGERHARAEDGLRTHTRSARSTRDEMARRTIENVFPKRRGVLISTSELQRSQPCLAMISGLRVAQSSR